MPFSSRDRPRLSDRMRGKSRDDWLNEFKSAFDNNRKLSFEQSPWRNREFAFPRGFPFDDDEDDRDFDLESRIRGRPRGEGSLFSRGFGRPPRGSSASSSNTEDCSQPSHQTYKSDCEDPERQVNGSETSQEQPAGLNQHGLRNTVPFVQTRNDISRPPRAMSAPPGNRPPQRFVSTCELPPMAQPQNVQPPSTDSQATPQTPQGNVRLIPIQVEGRDEPLLNSNLDTTTNFAHETPSFEPRLPRDFGVFRKHSARFQPQSPPPTQQQPCQPQQQQQPKSQPQPPQQQQKGFSNQQQPPMKPSPPQQQAPNQQQPSAGVDEPDHTAADPGLIAISRVAEIQQDVAQLALQVESATPASRCDKEYMYLDEMLTRQLLRLDDIDTAGQDSVRQARRDAIRSIQRCISVLESKVPSEPMEVESSTGSEATSTCVSSEPNPKNEENGSIAQPEQQVLQPQQKKQCTEEKMATDTTPTSKQPPA